MNCKNILFVVLALFLSQNICVAQSSHENVVKTFGDYMYEWSSTKNFSYLEKIDKLVQGSKACRVDDGLAQIFVNQDKSGLISSGTMVMDKYLNYIDHAIGDNFVYNHGKPVWQKDYTEPVAFNDKSEAPLYFVSMDISTKGAVNFSGTDLFFVRDGQITKIVDFHDENSLAKAIALYSSRKYEEAFRLFRKLAYEDPNNFDAQYYTAVMEVKKQGCGFLNSKFRDLEAAWWLTRGAVSNSIEKDWAKERMAKVFTRFDVDEKLLPFNTRGKQFYIYSLMTKKPVSYGVMVYKNKKGLYGCMDESGHSIAPCVYQLVNPFDKSGHALVIKNGKVGYIDTKGNEVISPKFDFGVTEFYNGKTFVIQGENLLLIDDKGNILKEVGKGYDALEGIFVDGKAYVHHKTSKLWYVHDEEGNITSVEKETFSIDYKKFCYFKNNPDGKRILEEYISWK